MSPASRKSCAMFEAVDRHFGRLDALVNNAGIVDRKARVDEMSAARLERMMRINVIGSFLCAARGGQAHVDEHGGKGGAIVNVSSVASKHGAPANMSTTPRQGRDRHLHRRPGARSRRPKAYASMRFAPASSTPRSTLPAASPTGPARCASSSRCSARAWPTRLRARSSVFCRMRRPIRRAPSSM